MEVSDRPIPNLVSCAKNKQHVIRVILTSQANPIIEINGKVC